MPQQVPTFAALPPALPVTAAPFTLLRLSDTLPCTTLGWRSGHHAWAPIPMASGPFTWNLCPPVWVDTLDGWCYCSHHERLPTPLPLDSNIFSGPSPHRYPSHFAWALTPRISICLAYVDVLLLCSGSDTPQQFLSMDAYLALPYLTASGLNCSGRGRSKIGFKNLYIVTQIFFFLRYDNSWGPQCLLDAGHWPKHCILNPGNSPSL